MRREPRDRVEARYRFDDPTARGQGVWIASADVLPTDVPFGRP